MTGDDDDDFALDLSGPGHIEISQIQRNGRWHWTVRVDGRELTRGSHHSEFTDDERENKFATARQYLAGLN
jgi:hypothetical protein